MKRISILIISIFPKLLECQSVKLHFVRTVVVSFLVLSTGLVEAGGAEVTREVELHLSTTSSQAATNNLSKTSPTTIKATVISHKRTKAKTPRQRNPEISPQHLVIVGMDAQGREISRAVTLDPRIIRAETADISGKFTRSGLIYREDVNFSVMMPDDSNIVAIKIYQPRSTNSRFALNPIGEAKLPEMSHD